MKKAALAISVAMALMTGCASTGGETVSPEALNAKGVEIYNQSMAEVYKPSLVKDLEVARTAINTAFLMGKPAYETYYKESMAYPELQNVLAAVENAESKEGKQAVYDALSPEEKQLVNGYLGNAKTKEVMKGLASASAVALKNIAIFETVDTSALLKQVKFADLMVEKDKLALTVDQVSYLKDSVVRSYSLYQQLAALKTAE